MSQPPNKWTVYEQILRIPYYFVFYRYNDEFQAFGLTMNRYQPLPIRKQGVWLEEAKLGLGLWQGTYQGIERLWLRCYNREGNWILTPTEREKQEQLRAEQEKQRADNAEERSQELEALLARYQEQFGELPRS